MTNHARATAKAKAQSERPVDDLEVFDASGLLEEIKAQAKPFRVTKNGEVFWLPSPTAWPDAAFKAAFSDDDPVSAAQLILGEEAYGRFAAEGGNSLFLQRMVAVLHGASLGEFMGSSSSSGSTPGPSKPTSSATTASTSSTSAPASSPGDDSPT